MPIRLIFSQTVRIHFPHHSSPQLRSRYTGEYKTMNKARKWRKEIPTIDPILKDGKPTDIVIPIMGPTGVGKSTFVNALCGANVTDVGHGLVSCTATLKPAIISLPPGQTGSRCVIVDTPGFDDTYIEDSEILRRIAVWLAMSYDRHMKLAGVIYLHDISQPRILGTIRKNFQVFHKLCGDDALSVVILGTTKWEQVGHKVGEERESHLAAKFWDIMIQKGSVIRRFHNNHDSALDMINYLVESRGNVTALHIQRELVELHKLIPDTDAGRYLRTTLEQVLEKQRKRARRIEDTHMDHGQLQAEDKASQEEIRSILQSLQYLKVSISRRILIFFGLA